MGTLALSHTKPGLGALMQMAASLKKKRNSRQKEWNNWTAPSRQWDPSFLPNNMLLTASLKFIWHRGSPVLTWSWQRRKTMFSLGWFGEVMAPLTTQHFGGLLLCDILTLLTLQYKDSFVVIVPTYSSRKVNCSFKIPFKTFSFRWKGGHINKSDSSYYYCEWWAGGRGSCFILLFLLN